MENSDNSKTRPYSSFGTFLTTLDHYGAVGIPNLVDRNTLPPTLSGSSRYEVLATLRFFDLVNADGKPNVDLLKRLINEDTRRETMLALLRQHYSGLFELPLATAGPSEIKKWFTENATPSTVGRAQAFFLSGAKQMGVPLHTLVSKGTRTVTGSVKRKRRKPNHKPGTDSPPLVADPEDEFESGSQHGTSRSVALREGAGTVAIRVSVDLWELEGSDRDFVFGLMDSLKLYEKGEVLLVQTGRSSLTKTGLPEGKPV